MAGLWKRTTSIWRCATRDLRVLPDFLIIGAQRSGSSTLYQHIGRHPCVGRAFRKEIHFFDRQYQRGLAWYRGQFPTRIQRWVQRQIRGAFVTGESSPSYLSLPHVPARVAAALPAVKLIAIVRDPIDRALSAYQRRVRTREEHRNFAEAVAAERRRSWAEVAQELAAMDDPRLRRLPDAYVARGLYADQLAMWLEHFPREQLLIVSAEQMFADPLPVLNRVYAFLGISIIPATARSMQEWVRTKYSYGRYADMDEGLRRELAEYYRPHNERLYALAGENLGWERPAESGRVASS